MCAAAHAYTTFSLSDMNLTTDQYLAYIEDAGFIDVINKHSKDRVFWWAPNVFTRQLPECVDNYDVNVTGSTCYMIIIHEYSSTASAAECQRNSIPNIVRIWRMFNHGDSEHDIIVDHNFHNANYDAPINGYTPMWAEVVRMLEKEKLACIERCKE